MRLNWLKYLFVAMILLLAPAAGAATVDEIRSKISNHNSEIQKLEAQITAYQNQLRTTEKTSRSLQSEISRLETTKKKLETDIKVTAQEISKTDLELEGLGIEIDSKDATLARRRAAVAESLRQWRLTENRNLLELLATYDSLSRAWNEVSTLAAFSRNLKQDIDKVADLKTDLEASKQATERERQELARLKERLADQQEIARENQVEKDRLLGQTKNQESNFKKLLADSLARKEAFEKELSGLESDLRIAINFDQLPVGKGVLKWPLDSVFITQSFGKTVDAKRLYVSGTHNGIDLRASQGTRVLAARSGVIKATGDTDTVCRGASYGKWVLIDHKNGLSTLYGHLSLIKASAGQEVITGDVIGYSGQTGYSTGPHLHFTVYATEGMRISDYNFRSCSGVKITLPLADPQAYLDPLIYL
ncbi:MAG: peptidoglycan DD-metalloendopeptidase family protein [Patescibacteria group bacterium]